MNIIIGAGISGLTTGKNLKNDFIILEREKSVGGLATQYRSGGYWFDFGGHYFHFKHNSTIKEYLQPFAVFKQYSKKSFVFMQNRFIPFPIQFHLSFLPARIRHKVFAELMKGNPGHYTDLSMFLKGNFGTTLYKLFFSPFLSKYYNTDLRKIMADMDRGSIPVPDKETVQLGYQGKRFSRAGYNSIFYYPNCGLLGFIENYSHSLKNKIHLATEVVQVDLQKKKVTTNNKSFFYENLISTIPLNQFLQRVKSGPELADAGNLKHTSTLVVNLILSRKRRRFHWVYLQENQFPFYRAGFYPGSNPTACYLEKSITSLGKLNKQLLAKDILFTLKQLGIVRDKNEILFTDYKIIPVSYVLFDRNWKKLVPPLLKKLTDYRVYSIGRFGSWNYSSMSNDVAAAIKLAKELNKK